MTRAVITHALRTPIGKFMGGFNDVTSVELGVAVVKPILEAAGLDSVDVDQLIFGNGRQAGAGPNPARQIAIKSGISHRVIAYTMNMACASGLKSIALAAQAIELGEATVVVAGGTESMSRLPYLLPKARDGYRLGHAPLVDAMYQDGFQCPLAEQLMGATAENLVAQYNLSREDQDAFAVTSQNRSQAARASGLFADEIQPVTVIGRRKEVVIDADEHVRDDVKLESLAKLKPVFKKDGSVHAGNSSGITDGAAALLLMSEEEATNRGLEILGIVEGSAAAGVDPKLMGLGPVPATAALNTQLDLTLADYDLIELNEAFAAQALACLKEWGIDNERVNVNGGAISLGHPIGATGARIVVTLLHEMKRRSVKRGLATLCVSGGLGMSMSLIRK